MKRVLLVTAALVAAVAVWTVVSLPARTRALDGSWADGTVPGLIHIHTNRSDGLSDPDTIAAAAARAGLKFIIFSDHGDGTRTPDPPVYRGDVLCLDGVEISTSGGHYIALGLGASPYPLGGEPRDVVEDVERLGGFGIAAHPDSPKRELAWRDWGPRVDALEVLNPDNSWRAHLYRGGLGARVRLLSSLATYPFRPSETIGALLTESTDAKAEWTRLLGTRQVVGLAGVDAHAKLALRDSEPGDSRFSLSVPGYETSFRTMSSHVRPTGPMTGDAAVDAARLLAGIRGGQIFTALDAWATPARFIFTATASSRTVGEGEIITPAPSLTLHVRHNGAEGFQANVWREGESVASARTDQTFDVPIGAVPGAYRVEVRDPRHPNGPAWITSNPIYVREPAAVVPAATDARRPASGRPGNSLLLFDGRGTSGWTIESDRSSLSAVNVIAMVGGPELRVRYGLSGGPDTGQFAGVAVDTIGGVGSMDRLTFTMRSEHPMRVSIQVRAEVRGAQPERWQRSVYVDGTDRTQSVFFDDMMPVGETHTPRPPNGAIRNIMFMIDTTNTAPGRSGSLWLRDVRLEQ